MIAKSLKQVREEGSVVTPDFRNLRVGIESTLNRENQLAWH